jgi:hypothetical protein
MNFKPHGSNLIIVTKKLKNGHNRDTIHLRLQFKQFKKSEYHKLKV